MQHGESLACRAALETGSGGGTDSELLFQHPLERVHERDYDVWAGEDCWGFRPAISREDAVDIVGMWLRGESHSYLR